MSQMACLWFCSMSSFTRFYKSVSYHLSPLQNQDLIDPKKNCLMEMILLQNQEPEFYIWFLFTKSKTHTIHVGQKGFQGNYPLQNQIPSPLLSQNHYRIKIWRYDIKGHAACFTRKSKTLGCDKPHLYKISCMPKKVRFVHSRLTVEAPVYRIMDLLRYSPNMTKIDDFWVLTSPWSLIEGSPESKIFGLPAPSIL